jgi:hypothetical protein
MMTLFYLCFIPTGMMIVRGSRFAVRGSWFAVRDLDVRDLDARRTYDRPSRTENGAKSECKKRVRQKWQPSCKDAGWSSIVTVATITEEEESVVEDRQKGGHTKY